MTHDSTDRTIRIEVPAVVVDLYRDIHKGIRAELFDVTLTAGRIDPVDEAARRALAGRIGEVAFLLRRHAEHEDDAILPTLEAELPALAEAIVTDHGAIEGRIDDLEGLAAEAVEASAADARLTLHRFYLELASFTAAYLEHQDVEERVVMPALEAAVGPEQTGAIHGAIVGSIPPAELATSLAVMLPAMNVDDRAGLLGGIRANAPAEAFAGIWGLAGTVLTPADHAALATRLGLD